MRSLTAIALVLGSLLTARAFAADEEDPLASGRWTSYAYGSWTAAGGEHLNEVHVGLGRFLVDGLSVSLETVGGLLDFGRKAGPTAQTWAAGLDLVARWHPLRAAMGSLYVDAGTGLRLFGSPFPVGGTRFDFALRAGVGGTAYLARNVSLEAGVGWFHISNAALWGIARNPGHNAAWFQGGLLVLW